MLRIKRVAAALLAAALVVPGGMASAQDDKITIGMANLSLCCAYFIGMSDAVQADIPGSMYMYPVSTAVALPPVWAKWAPLSDHPYTVKPADISAHRDDWIKQWTDLVTG